MIVKQFEGKNGPVKNQFLITGKKGEVIFQSYSNIIAIKYPDGKIILDSTYWNYSVTTGKYRNQFLNETKKETEAKIKAGVYKLKELNKALSYNYL